jgi:hypothetical protein
LFAGIYNYWKKKVGVDKFDTLPDTDTVNKLPVDQSNYLLLQAAFDSRLIPQGTPNASLYTRVPHAFLELQPFTNQVTDTSTAAVSNRFLAVAVPQTTFWFWECILPMRADITAGLPSIAQLQAGQQHIKTQYNTHLGGFPEIKDAKEFTEPFRLPELKFQGR